MGEAGIQITGEGCIFKVGKILSVRAREGNYIEELMTGWQLKGIKEGAEQRVEKSFISFIRLSKGLWHKKWLSTSGLVWLTTLKSSLPQIHNGNTHYVAWGVFWKSP